MFSVLIAPPCMIPLHMSMASGTLTPGVHPLTDCHPSTDSFRSDVLHGLQQSPKQLPSKYLYDERGSQLFDAICELDAYYPTRTEMSIMQTHRAAIAAEVGTQAAVVEYGSGSSTKTRILLEALDDVAAYVPVDIAREHLQDAAERIADTFPALPVYPVCADYNADVPIPIPAGHYTRVLAYYPGSTIGNFQREDARAFLERMATLVGPNGAVLIGVDLKKDPDRLRHAYNDPEGITAAFNKNVLRRINRELGADFQLDRFRHEGRWVPEHGRIEMHLVSTEAHSVHIGEETISFERGESICTEYSHKYTIEESATLAAEAGLSVQTVWTDPERLFSVQYAVPHPKKQE